jgi:hypothetical protein
VKFLILTADYPEFLEWLYTSNPALNRLSYEEQVATRYESLFGVADSYSNALTELGHEATDIYINNRWAQLAWIREHSWTRRAEFSHLRHIARSALTLKQRDHSLHILKTQIEKDRPDVLLNQAVDALDPRFLREVSRSVRLIVGQHAAPLPEDLDLSCYDLMVSSLPNQVEMFRSQGLRSEVLPLAFDPRILSQLPNEAPTIDCSFVGSISRFHGRRMLWLDTVCKNIDVDLWGASLSSTDMHPLPRPWNGRAWGIDMYRILRTSRITLNHHIDLAGEFANNSRLYEATGVGTLLITDAKRNLPTLFKPGKEVVSYQDADECVELINYYLSNESKRTEIANQGQARTLRDHTIKSRMTDFLELIERLF